MCLAALVATTIIWDFVKRENPQLHPSPSELENKTWDSVVLTSSPSDSDTWTQVLGALL